MGQPACILAPQLRPRRASAREEAASLELRSLARTAEPSLARRRSLTLATSLVLHAALVAVAIAVPLLLFEDALLAPEQAVRAFFVSPPDVAPAPPPPPPPAAPLRTRAPAAPLERPAAARFVAPVQAPEDLPANEGIALGVEGGVPGGLEGGVEGGVPGGVVGGILGGLPRDAPPPPPRVVRVGGDVRAPRLVHQVKPVYPVLAAQARVAGMVIVEAHVGTDGRVRTARVLRGNPVLDPAALEAVQQWRYQPLLLNGAPTEFILIVTLNFALVTPAASAPGP